MLLRTENFNPLSLQLFCFIPQLFLASCQFWIFLIHCAQCVRCIAAAVKLHFPEKSLSYRFVCFGYGDVILENGLFYASCASSHRNKLLLEKLKHRCDLYRLVLNSWTARSRINLGPVKTSFFIKFKMHEIEVLHLHRLTAMRSGMGAYYQKASRSSDAY